MWCDDYDDDYEYDDYDFDYCDNYDYDYDDYGYYENYDDYDYDDDYAMIYEAMIMMHMMFIT